MWGLAAAAGAPADVQNAARNRSDGGLEALKAGQGLADTLLQHRLLNPTGPSPHDAEARATLEALKQIDWNSDLVYRVRGHARAVQGALEFCLSGPTAGARAALEAAVKLQPRMVEAWNCLGHVTWEQGHLPLALHCFNRGAEVRPNPESLRQLSMVLRQLGSKAGSSSGGAGGSGGAASRGEVLAASSAAARHAVLLDVADCYSWYVLGLAQLATAFHKGGCRRTLQAALAAFRRAGPGLAALPDLPYNQAVVACYLGDWGAALEGFSAAAALDDGQLPTGAQLEGVTRLLGRLTALCSPGGCGLKVKQAAALAVLLAADAGKDPCAPYRCKQAGLEDLTAGPNPGRALLLRSLAVVESPVGAAAAHVVAMGAGGACVALCLSGMSPKATAAIMGQQVTCLHPTLAPVSLAWRGRAYAFPCVRMDSLEAVLVDGVPLEGPERAAVAATSFFATAGPAAAEPGPGSAATEAAEAQQPPQQQQPAAHNGRPPAAGVRRHGSVRMAASDNQTHPPPVAAGGGA